MTLGPNESSWTSQRAHEMLNIMESEFTEMCTNIGKEYTRPSVVFRARLSRLPDGRWCAFIRDVFTTERGISASEFNTIGKTPDEAMRNFDKAWFQDTFE